MDVAALQEHCLALPGAWPDNPWEHDHPVIKVGEGERGKIFAFLGADSVGVKAGRSREAADAWLDRHPGAATVMAYIGRSGWNSLKLNGAIPDDELLEAVEESYRLVVEGLPKKHRPTGWETVGGIAADQEEDR
jgi:predicted DNA-binding protein (MmcQ/YjbR family)